MKKLLLIALLIVGCEETVAPLTIHGCLDGQATNYDATASIDNNTCTYIDSCGVIDIDKTNDCVQDCAGEWDGIASEDCNGVCGGGAVTLWGDCYDVEGTTTLNLYNNQLTGEIPESIGNLVNLTAIRLANNQLTGEIPSEIGTLTNLTELDLTNNQLTGGIPVEIGNLMNLRMLFLIENQLTGEIPPEVCDLIESNNINIDDIISGNNLTNTCD